MVIEEIDTICRSLSQYKCPFTVAQVLLLLLLLVEYVQDIELYIGMYRRSINFTLLQQ